MFTYFMSQRKKTSTIRPVWPEKPLISLYIHLVWQDLVHSFLNSLGVEKGTNDQQIHQTAWMCRLCWVFAGRTSLIVDLVAHWLICQSMANVHSITTFWLGKSWCIRGFVTESFYEFDRITNCLFRVYSDLTWHLLSPLFLTVLLGICNDPS